MKFSVIIPLYNKAPYVRKALESVFAQTYTDYELIVIDDGSTDDSAEIAEEVLQEATPHRPIASSPYRLLKQANAGVSAARNNGVASSNGDYVSFLDADDWWDPIYLERMAQLIEDYPDAGLYASNYYYHKDGINIIKVDIPTGYFNYPLEYFKNFAMPVWTGATIISRKVYDEMGGFPLGIKLGEDFLLWSKIAIQYPVAFLNEPLAYYNNTLLANYRATRNLHVPEHHMLFRLEVIMGQGYEATRLSGSKASRQENGAHETTRPHRPIAQSPYRPTDEDWLRLIDMLRLLGLHSYWLSNEYYDIAQHEIDKVDMNQQYDFLVKLYRSPRWVQRFKQRLLQIVAGPIALLKRFRQKKKMVQTNIIITNKEYRKSMGLPL